KLSRSPRYLWAGAIGGHSKRATANGSSMSRRRAFSRQKRFRIRYLLANHLVRQHDHRRRKCQAECLGGLQIDDQLEERGPLEREVGRLRAPQDLVHIVGCSAL